MSSSRTRLWDVNQQITHKFIFFFVILSCKKIYIFHFIFIQISIKKLFSKVFSGSPYQFFFTYICCQYNANFLKLFYVFPIVFSIFQLIYEYSFFIFYLLSYLLNIFKNLLQLPIEPEVLYQTKLTARTSLKFEKNSFCLHRKL